MQYDVLIKNARIVDGTGAAAYQGDVGVVGERITEIGRLGDDAGLVIDARGKAVSPGFIDAHSHSDYLLAMDFPATNLLEQGVTSEICGPCGESAVPCFPGFYDNYKNMLPVETVDLLYRVQGSIQRFTDYMADKRLATNVGMMIGNGTIRGNVMGLYQREPTKHEMEDMRALVRAAMESGFLGLSSGLCYPPSCFAYTDELVSLAAVAAEYGGVYSSHIRSESDGVVEAVQEALEIAKRAGLPLVLSHHKIIGARNEGKSERTLAMVDAANQEGRQVYLDQYPYLSGCANLLDAIPPVYRAKGWPALKERIVNADFRNQLRQQIEGFQADFENFLGNAGYDGTRILSCQEGTGYQGKTIAQIAAERNEAPFDAFLNILIEQDANLFAAYAFTSKPDMERIMAHPNVMVGSDMYRSFMEHAADEPGHPRETATFVRYLRLVREQKICTLEEIVRRMAALPARVYSLKDRGLIRRGYFADICVFDYENLTDRADYAKAYLKNEGIDTVLVNGRVAVENGRANGIRNGVFLKRGG